MGITETSSGVTIITNEAAPAPTLIVTEEGTVNILTVIERGPQGIPGPEGDEGIPGPTGGVSSTKTTRLLITGSKSASSVYSVTSSGVNYTQEGDDGLLSNSADVFNASCSVFVFLNGLSLTKGTQVIWLSTTSFQLEAAVDNGDEIVILS